MRIDLHTHTQKCKKGDPDSRAITPQNFVEKMLENDVMICSITNHNKFDIEEYNTITKIAPELVIFPGIELDVLKNEKACHIIVIGDPVIKEKFHKIFDNDEGRNYDSYNLTYDKFLKKVRSFNSNEIIIIPHFADKDRAIGAEFADSPKNELNDYVVILETAKLHTMGMINSHGYLSLIGSDVQDWKKYSAYHLPEIKFRINSFGKFYELTNDSNTFIKNTLKSSPSNEILIDETSSSSLTMYEDINVIFGEKGSGKTILLKEILKSYYDSLGKKTFLHEGKEYQTLYESMIQKLQSNIEIDEELKETIKRDFDDIISYRERPTVDFVKGSFDYRNSRKKSKNRELLKKADASFVNTINTDFSRLLEQCELDIKYADKVLEINKKSNRDKLKKSNLDKELKDLQTYLIANLKMGYKEIFTNINIENFYSNLKHSARKNSGSESKPSTLGFAMLVANRLSRLKSNVNIKDNLSAIQRSETQTLGYLPSKGKTLFNTKIVVLSRDVKHEKNSVFDRGRIKLNRDLIAKIEDFNFKNFREINSYFDESEKSVDGKTFCKDIIKKDSLVSIPNNANYSPSEGEKAILSISGILENYSYDCYLFDEIERGLGNKYVTEYVIPQLKKLRNSGKCVVISTHNANLAINTLPSQCVFCDYKNENEEIYFTGNMYSDVLFGVKYGDTHSWEESALLHLEGSEEMFNRRKNIYGI